MLKETLIFDRKLKEEQAYWLAQLSREPGTPHLAAGKRLAAGGAESRVEFLLPEDLARKLARATAGSPFLLYTFFTAALKVCLQRHAGTDLIVVGSPALKEAARPNALAIVDEVDDSLTFREFVLQVRETLLAAYARQQYPFARLLQDLEANGAARRTLFDVALALKDFHGELPEAGHGLAFVFARDGERIFGEITFEGAALSLERVEGLKEHFVNVLCEAVDNPQTPLRAFRMLSEAERRRLTAELNDTSTARPRDEYLHEIFAAHAAAAPESVAVEFRGGRLTYGELNERADRLARRLRKMGVGPDVPVGILSETTPDVPTAVLAVLKAGGAYLPIDPLYPRERVAFMLEDAAVKVLLTQERFVAGLSQWGGATVALDAEPEQAETESGEDLSVRLSPDNLAYVIYTSGSTGTPKGAMVTHGGLSNYLSWALGAYRTDEGEGAPMHSSIAFDLSVTSMLGPLRGGRRVILVDGEAGVEGLGEVLRTRRDLSLVKMTPAHSRLLSRQLYSGEAAGRARALVIGGEALTAGDIAFWQQYAPETRIINEYGPTETVVGCCVYEVPAGLTQSDSILIGRPIANTQLFILDRYMRPQPAGVPGELYIGGDGLARGYLGRPALTAEKFVPNPFSNAPGARLYRTGDLAAYQFDGNIEFLGRADDQVKVRGFRIELGEIEAALSAHGSVRQCAVVVVEDTAGEKRLAAYVVAAAEGFAAGELRTHLKATLPEYMIPSLFVALEELPLTTNGKVDRKRLPSAEAAAESAFEAPRTATEEVLAGVWSQVLGLPRVGVNDNFFDLGGHSLLATQVVSRVRRIFQVEMALRAVFAAPTVAAFASKVEEAVSAGRGLQAPPVTKAARGEALPLSFAQQRLWFAEQWQPGSSALHITEAVRLSGRLDARALELALREIVRRHESLRTTFRTVRGEARQVVSQDASFELPVKDLRSLPEATREAEALRLSRAEAERPFDLSSGPLMRAALLRLADEEHVLFVSMHHIVSDAWSLGVLVRELTALYAALCEGRPSPLAELPIQYADYASWQRAWMKGEVLDLHLEYWRRQLEGAPFTPPLPTDRPRPAVQTTNGARLDLSFDATLAQSLKALSRGEGVTLFMTLGAAFQTLLRYRSGREDVLLGTDVANRNRFETEGLVGFFINQLVLRADFSGVASFAELLGRVRAATLGAYAHQDVPFDRLVEALRVERTLQYAPLFQIKFVFQNAPSQPLELPGLTASALDVHGATSKFDLTLTLWEQGDELRGWFEYNSDLFEAANVARLREEFRALLEAVAAEPGAGLASLDASMAAAGRRFQSEREQAGREALAQKFMKVRRKAVAAAPQG